MAKLKSQYGFNENPENAPRLNDYYNPSTPVVNAKPAVLIEKAQTREILVSGQTKESNDFSCLVTFDIVVLFLNFIFRSGMHSAMSLIGSLTESDQLRYAIKFR